jgi:membrane protease YdiL (CAAX protease family)
LPQGPDGIAIALSTLVFALYHVPYACTRPGSPTLGDFPAAVQTGFTNGLVGGIPIALLFWRSRYNLAPVILLHAAIDLLPATRWLSGVLLAG